MRAVRIGAASLFIVVGVVTLWSAWRPVA
jgi:hypothetical protein